MKAQQDFKEFKASYLEKLKTEERAMRRLAEAKVELMMLEKKIKATKAYIAEYEEFLNNA